MPDAPLTLAGALTGMDNPPPDDTPKTGREGAPGAPAANAAGTPTIPEPEIKELAPEEPEEEPNGNPGADDAPETMEGAMRRGIDEETAKAEAEAAQKKKDEEAAAPTEAAKKKESETKPATERDADLKHEHAPHTHPKTRKVITDFQNKARAARDERDAVIAEREALKRERDELVAKTKTTHATLPKEIETELATLRERVRELDIAQDPQIIAKYDKPIQANNDAIVAVLKAQGYGMKLDAEGKAVDNPAAIATLLKSGLTYDNLQPLIDKLKTAGMHADARKIEKAIDRNEDLAEQRGREIDTWKKDHGLRMQQREQVTKAQSEAQNKAFAQQTDAQLKADLDTLAKDFPALKEPPQPTATDTPAVKQAKEKAIADYNAAAEKIAQAVKGFDTANIPADKMPEVVGRINAAAIQAIVLKTHLLPRMKAEAAANTARIKELETELETLRNAGRLSRAQTNSPSEPTRGAGEAGSLEEALRHAMPS